MVRLLRPLPALADPGPVGVYSTAPFWGRIVDSRGPRILLALAFFSLLIGYNGLRLFYDQGVSEGETDISKLTFGALVVCGFLTGIGGNGGLTSAMNSTAKSFPDSLVRRSCPKIMVGINLYDSAPPLQDWLFLDSAYRLSYSQV